MRGEKKSSKARNCKAELKRSTRDGFYFANRPEVDLINSITNFHSISGFPDISFSLPKTNPEIDRAD